LFHDNHHGRLLAYLGVCPGKSEVMSYLYDTLADFGGFLFMIVTIAAVIAYAVSVLIPMWNERFEFEDNTDYEEFWETDEHSDSQR
jgi:ABC-type long-subunit fatty acid transport system fused permease/ATPase subunit